MTTAPRLEEELRLLGFQCAILIRANVEEWRATAEWLNRLPICWAVRSSNDRGHPALGDGRFLWWDEYSPNGEFFVYDDEAEEARVLGPTCRRILNGWSAAFHPFHVDHRTTFIGLTAEAAKRITLLAALTLDADFDGADLELGWSWRCPSDSPAKFEGRELAWSLTTRFVGSEETLRAVLGKALQHLEGRGLVSPVLVVEPDDSDVDEKSAPVPQPTTRKNGIRLDKAVNLWMKVRDLGLEDPVAGPVIYKTIEKSPQFLSKHVNPLGVTPREDRLTLVERPPKGARGNHYIRDSVLGWLAGYFGLSVDEMNAWVNRSNPTTEGQTG